MSQPPYQQPGLPLHTPPRRPVAPVVVILLVLGGCGMVAVVGVAIVAAILFPVFAQAREAARSASCQSNLKQLALAVQMYTQDHDGRYPRSGAWADATAPYDRNPGMLICPSEAARTPGYAYNAALHRRHEDWVKVPARQPMLFDSILGKPNGSDRLESFALRHRYSGSRVANVAWADGHVSREARPPAATAGLKPGSKP